VPFFSMPSVSVSIDVKRSPGILYAFLGISLATKNYVNPSIDIIKKRGIVSIPANLRFLFSSEQRR
jgi:hypothetical protein